MESVTLIVDDDLKAETIFELFPQQQVNCFVCKGNISEVVGFTSNNTLQYQLRDLSNLNNLFSECNLTTSLYFATSNSLKGEKNASDLYSYFKIDPSEKRRIKIKSYTLEGIQNAINDPLYIDVEKVNEYIRKESENYQFAFEVSPWLWSQISNTYEKKLTLNVTQSHIFENLIQETQVEYILKAYFTKKQLCFHKRLDTLAEVCALAQRIISTNLVLKQVPYANVDTNTRITLSTLINDSLSSTDLNLSVSEIIQSYKRLLYKGFIYINDNNEVGFEAELKPALKNKHDHILYTYISKTLTKALSNKNSINEWVISSDNDEICLTQSFDLTPNIEQYLSTTNSISKLTLNAIETCIIAKPICINIDDQLFVDELERMEYKGYIDLTNNRNRLTQEYEGLQYRKSGSSKVLEPTIQNVEVRSSLLQPLGYIVYQFFKDNYEDYPDHKFEISLDDSHSCIIAKYGLVIRQTNIKDVTFIKLKSKIDFKSLYVNKVPLEDLINKTDVAKNRFTKYFNDQKVTLKNGKYGIYAEVISKDQSKKNISLKEFGNRPIENILWEDVFKLLQVKKKNL